MVVVAKSGIKYSKMNKNKHKKTESAAAKEEEKGEKKESESIKHENTTQIE